MAPRLPSALLLLLVGSGMTAAAAEDFELKKVERVHLDDVWPAPDGGRVVELYIRTLTRHLEPVEDLHPAHIAVIDAGERIDTDDLEVKNLSKAGRGVTCVIAIDVSRTMKGDPFTRAKAAAGEFLEHVEARDRVAIVAFSDEARVISPFADAKAAAKVALEDLRVDDESLNTVLFDGVHEAVDLVRKGQGLPRRAFIIVFSDGNDSGSQRSLDQVIERARGDETRPPALIFTIGYARFGGEGLATLNQLAEQTGAVYLPATSTIHISSFFAAIWRQMIKSYVVRYPGRMDGKLHKIEVEIEGQTSTRVAKYPKVTPPWWWYGGVVGLVVLVALVALLIARGRPKGRLVFEGGPLAGEVFVLRKERTSIGALEDNDIVVASDTISKYHAFIYRRGRELEIEDADSLNGTYVNGTRVRTSPLRPGDRIRVADIDLVYQR